MMHILTHAAQSHEFATADAINELGALAVVPRRVDFAPDGQSYSYRPFLPNYLFCVMTEAQWHSIHRDRLFRPDGSILPPIRRILDILPRTWGEFQGFAARAELACEYRIEQFETGRKVRRYKAGDRLRIIGDMLDGQLRDKLARFIKLDGKGGIVVQVEGLEFMGKPIRATLKPGQAMAAE